jgi:hypothetical protein
MIRCFQQDAGGDNDGTAGFCGTTLLHFRLEDHVPADHMLRLVDDLLDTEFVFVRSWRPITA